MDSVFQWNMLIPSKPSMGTRLLVRLDNLLPGILPGWSPPAPTTAVCPSCPTQASSSWGTGQHGEAGSCFMNSCAPCCHPAELGSQEQPKKSHFDFSEMEMFRIFPATKILIFFYSVPVQKRDSPHPAQNFFFHTSTARKKSHFPASCPIRLLMN